MPIKQIIVSDEESELYELVKKRLNEPEKSKTQPLMNYSHRLLYDLFN